ncbi:hypothetical protein Purlil1_10682 [Purpureocillium lilacinum]|uniref:Uncharacterized protein n=1 Tax=Purpureocillium lilacinum TaxID=33203 RepID=A0ABR0BN64_PURLI|nr:hypothetical protein Purlil1_10682 [Purpureocillium lilacinum]
MDRYLLSPPTALRQQRPRPQHCTCEACPPPPAYNQQWLSRQGNQPLPPSYTQATQPQSATKSTPSQGGGLHEATEVNRPRPPSFLTRCLQKIADATAFDEDKTSLKSSGPEAVFVVRVEENSAAQASECLSPPEDG